MTDYPEDRIVELIGVIDDECANRVIAQLLFHQMQDKESPVILRIDSPGGSVTASLAILETMRFVKCPVITECRGSAHGCAALIFAAGAPGRRKATRSATFGLARTVLTRPAEDPKDTAGNLSRLQERLIAELSRACQQEPSCISRDMAVERQFTISEAIAYGFADAEICRTLTRSRLARPNVRRR